LNANGNGDGNRDVWKWITAIIFTAMIAGAPGYIIAIRSPSQAEVQLIRDRQIDVLQRLAVAERRLDDSDTERLELRALIVALQTELRGTP
jgi:hypothetical protein